MPSGSKKRKASKKPKPGESLLTPQLGEPPELDTGLEYMANEGEEILEGSPSPKATEEANPECAEGGTDLNREAPTPVLDEADVEEAPAPALDEVRSSDPPSLPELETDIPLAETPDRNEIEGEAAANAAEREPAPQIDEQASTVAEEVHLESVAEETKREAEEESAADGIADDAEASADDIVGEADAIEPKEEAYNEIGSEPWESQKETVPGTDEYSVEPEQSAEMTEPEREPVNKLTPDRIFLDLEPRVDESVDVNPVPDEAPAHDHPESDETTVVRDLDSDAVIEREGTDAAAVETAADTSEGTTGARPEMHESVDEKELKLGAVPEHLGVEPEIESVSENPQTEAVPGNLDIEPKMAATPVDVERGLAEAPVMEGLDSGILHTDDEPAISDDIVLAAMDGISVETRRETDEDAVLPTQPDCIEPETTAATAENEAEKETAEAEGDASVDESLQEVEQAPPSIEPQLAAEEPEIELSLAGAELKMEPVKGEAECEVESSLGKIEPDVNVTVDEIEKDEVVQPETEPEDDVVQADSTQEPKEINFPEVEPNAEVEGTFTALVSEADATKENAEIGELEANAPRIENNEPAEEPVAEISEYSKEDGIEGNKALLEPEKYPGGSIPVNELEAEAALSEFKLGQQSSSEKEFMNQQDLDESEPNQSNGNECNQQVEEQEREKVSGFESLDLPAADAVESGVDVPGLSATEVDQVEAAANDSTDMPGMDQEITGETNIGASISPSPEVLLDEAGEAADKDVTLDVEENGPVVVANGAKNESIEQQAVADDKRDEGKASFGGADTTVEYLEQDLSIEPSSDATDDTEVSLKEKPSEEEPVTSQPAPDNEYLIMDPTVSDVDSGKSKMIEQGLRTSLHPQSEMPICECESKDEFAFEQGKNFDSPSGDIERDVGEEEAASSTVAEAGSVLNDFDESASYQQLPSDSLSEQDADVSESREFDDSLFTEAHEPIETDSAEPTHGECKQDDTMSILVDESDQVENEKSAMVYSQGEANGVSLMPVPDISNDEVEWKSVQDLEASSSKPAEITPEYTKSNDTEPSLLASTATLPVSVHLSELCNVPDNEIMKEEGGGDQNSQEAAAPAILGIVPASNFLSIAKEELTSKVSPGEVDGHVSETPTNGLVASLEKTGTQDGTVATINESEICTVEAPDLSAATNILPEKKFENNYYEGTPLQSASPGRDIMDIQTFHHQNTQEASLPVVVPAQDVKQRAMGNINLKANEGQRDRTVLQRRTKGFDCCGLLDVLFHKNQ